MKKINTHNLPENLRKMQDSAIKQAKDFKSKSTNKEKSKNNSENELNYLNHKTSFLNSILKDKENALIIILIVLLMDDEKNFTLILVLISLLI